MSDPHPTIDDDLLQIAAGDNDAIGRVLPVVYEDLRRLARGIQGRPQHSLNPTALVHEAYGRLVRSNKESGFEGRRHFMNVAAMAMRQLLADHARRRKASKRGDGVQNVTLNTGDALDTGPGIDLVVLDEALEEFAKIHPRQAKVVELRFLTGLSVEETAEALDVSPRTVKVDWQLARAWLSRSLREGDDD